MSEIVSVASITFRDAGSEPGVFRVHGTPLTAINFTAQQALWTTLKAKATALCLGVPSRTFYGNEILESWTQPTNGAMREVALLISGRDTTTLERLSYRLPTLDPTIPIYVDNPAARDAVVMDTPTAIADFIAAFNAFVLNPHTGNVVNVFSIRVGRGQK